MVDFRFLHLDPTDQTRIGRVDALKAFFDEHGAWPVDSGATRAERTAARFLRLLRDEDLHAEVAAYLAESLPPLPAAARQLRTHDLDAELAEFRAKHGRDPKVTRFDDAERNLARRLGNRTRKPTARPGDTPDPSTVTGRPRRHDLDRFERRLEELLAARARLGRWPLVTDASDDQRLAHFHMKLRSPMPASFQRTLQARSPELARWALDPRGARARNTEADIDALEAHLSHTGKPPRHTSEAAAERRLARRLSQLRSEGVTSQQRERFGPHLHRLALPTVAEARRRSA